MISDKINRFVSISVEVVSCIENFWIQFLSGVIPDENIKKSHYIAGSHSSLATQDSFKYVLFNSSSVLLLSFVL